MVKDREGVAMFQRTRAPFLSDAVTGGRDSAIGKPLNAARYRQIEAQSVKRQVTGGFGRGFGSGAGLRGVLRSIVSSCSGGRDGSPLCLFVAIDEEGSKFRPHPSSRCQPCSRRSAEPAACSSHRAYAARRGRVRRNGDPTCRSGGRKPTCVGNGAAQDDPAEGPAITRLANSPATLGGGRTDARYSRGSAIAREGVVVELGRRDLAQAHAGGLLCREASRRDELSATGGGRRGARRHRDARARRDALLLITAALLVDLLHEGNVERGSRASWGSGRDERSAAGRHRGCRG